MKSVIKKGIVYATDVEGNLTLNIPKKVVGFAKDFTLLQVRGLKKVTLNANVTELPASVFSTATKENIESSNNTIKTLVINSPITEIDSFAFSGLEGLEKLTLPDTIITIKSNAFANMKSLKTLELPDSVINLDARFLTESSVETLICSASVVSSIRRFPDSFPATLKTIIIDGEEMSVTCNSDYLSSVTTIVETKNKRRKFKIDEESVYKRYGHVIVKGEYSWLPDKEAVFVKNLKKIKKGKSDNKNV